MQESQDLEKKDTSIAVSRRDILKRGAVLTSSAFAIPTILSACGGTNDLVSSKNTGGKDKVLRVYWHPGHAYDAYQQVVAQFEKDNPGWKVQIERYQWPDLRSKLLANFEAHTVPDLVEEPGSWVQEFGRAGKLHSLQQFVDKDKSATGFPDDWQSYAVKRNTINGEIYGVQLHLTCVLCFYNTDLFAKAGIKSFPTNWDDFLATAKELTSKDVHGIVLNQDASTAWPWFLQNGVKLYDAQKNTIALDNDAAYEAFQFQADLIHKHKVSPVPAVTGSYDGPQKLFSAGRAAMILSGPWDIKSILTGSPNLKWDIAQALTRKVQATSSAGASLMIPKEAKNPEMAWELLKRFTQLNVEVAASKEARMTMPRKSWGQNEEIKKLDYVAPFGKGLTYAQLVNGEIEQTGKSGTVGELFTKTYQEVIYKKTPVEQALKAFVAEGNKVLAK